MVIATVNHDHTRLSEKERLSRQYFTSLKPSIDIPPDGILPIWCNDGKLRFKLKEPDWDAKGCIDGFFAEEDIRREFFYPYLPCNFIDIGVAHGSWTIPALAAGSNVLGFEIDPRFHQTLKGSLEVNPGFGGRMKLLALGMYKQYGIGNVNELEGVTFTTLDSVMRFQKGFTPDYIKIDVDGLEWGVLVGARHTLELFHPKLFIEVHYMDGYTQRQKDEIDDSLCDGLLEYDYKPVRGRGEKAFTYFFFS